MLAADGDLAQILFEGPGQDVAAFGELLDLAGDDRVDAGAGLGQLAEVGLRAPARGFRGPQQLLDLAGDEPIDVARASAAC